MERGKGANLAESQGEPFTQAALRRVGENANRATPEVIDGAYRRIGSQFDQLAARHAAQLDQPLVQDLTAAVNGYNNLVSAPNRTPAVANYLDEIRNAVQQNGGQIPGEVYQSLRHRMGETSRGLGGNTEARTAIRDMMEALDDVMERGSQASGRPADLGAWQNARNQYRKMLVIERAATGAGENAALGIITPAKLREATVGQNRRAYARGQGDFAELARSGEAVMRPLPNSGTAGRLAAQNLGTGTSSVVGALLGGGAGATLGPVGASLGGAAGAAAGAAAPRVIGSAVTSGPGRAYLSNQAAAPMMGNMTPGQAAFFQALLAMQRQREQQ